MENFAYFILGAFITGAVSLFFYIQSGAELKRESRRLGDLHELTIYILTHPKAAIGPKRDQEGNIVGVIVSATGNGSGSGAASAASSNG